MKNTLINVLSFSIILTAATMSAQAGYEFDEDSPIIQQLRKSPSHCLDYLDNAKDGHPKARIGSLIKMRELADKVAKELKEFCALPSVTFDDRVTIGKKWINEYGKVELPAIMENRTFTPASEEVYQDLLWAIANLGDDIQSFD